MPTIKLPQTIVEQARALPHGGVIFPKEFIHLASRSAVDQALSRLAKDGVLVRVGRGKYSACLRLGHPRQTTAEELARICSLQSGEQIVPDGQAEAVAFRLAPRPKTMQGFATAGKTREFSAGQVRIVVKHVPIWMMAPGNVGAAIRALCWLGPKKAGATATSLKRILDEGEWQRLVASRAALPSWMARAVGAAENDSDALAPMPSMTFSPRKSARKNGQATSAASAVRSSTSNPT